MKRLLITATAISMALGSAAFADTSALQAHKDKYTPDWDQTMMDSFYNPDTGDMLTADEITANWAKMTPEQQGMVREDCEDPNYSGSEMAVCSYIE